MLLSMTGHGEAQLRADGVHVSAEVRTVNNRFFKLTLRISEGYGGLESHVEAITRDFIRRGTVYANVRIDRERSPTDFRLNSVALQSYRQQLAALEGRSEEEIAWENLLLLPGAVDESAAVCDIESILPLVEQSVREALERLNNMRSGEGAAMGRDLKANCEVIGEQLNYVAERAPLVVAAYRDRLTERLKQLLSDFNISVTAADVVREVGLFAERSDISEEIVRLRSHLQQFKEILAGQESNGRKLEFLTQELFREANTIGSKANDAEIARHVVEIKTAVERVREMIQNVE